MLQQKSNLEHCGWSLHCVAFDLVCYEDQQNQQKTSHLRGFFISVSYSRAEGKHVLFSFMFGSLRKIEEWRLKSRTLKYKNNFKSFVFKENASLDLA